MPTLWSDTIGILPKRTGRSLNISHMEMCRQRCGGCLWSKNKKNLYPLVNQHFAMERSTMLFMGQSTISTGPFSIAMLVHQRVKQTKKSWNMSCANLRCQESSEKSLFFWTSSHHPVVELTLVGTFNWHYFAVWCRWCRCQHHLYGGGEPPTKMMCKG